MFGPVQPLFLPPPLIEIFGSFSSGGGALGYGKRVQTCSAWIQDRKRATRSSQAIRP